MPRGDTIAMQLAPLPPFMDRIWAPWRMDYIEGHSEAADCLFCGLPGTPDNLILHSGDRAYVVLNRFPYTNGHMMVVPFEHKPTLDGLDSDTLLELMHFARQAMTVLRSVYGAEAFNIGMNIGKPAGAGVVNHVHMHVLPRWEGDTNFMATTAKTRVIPEGLETTYDRLMQHWADAE